MRKSLTLCLSSLCCYQIHTIAIQFIVPECGSVSAADKEPLTKFFTFKQTSLNCKTLPVGLEVCNGVLEASASRNTVNCLICFHLNC